MTAIIKTINTSVEVEILACDINTNQMLVRDIESNWLVPRASDQPFWVDEYYIY